VLKLNIFFFLFDEKIRRLSTKKKNSIFFQCTLSLSLSGDTLSARGNSRPQVGALFGDGPRYSRALHFTFGIHYDPSIVLEIYERAILSPKRFPLSYNYGRHYFKEIKIEINF
jgi:hypothetical protein